MGFRESISYYSDSLRIVCIGYLISIIIFALYNHWLWGMSESDYAKIKLWRKMILRILVLLPVAVTVGIRGFYAGADTHGVWLEYVRCAALSFGELFSYDITALLYNMGSWIICKLTNANVQIFMTFLAILTLYFIIAGIEKWKLRYGGLALFIFYFCLGPNMMNQSRQMLSVAIMFYAFYYAFCGKSKKYALFVFLAGLIHLSALPAGIVIWFFNNNNRLKQRGFAFWLIFFVATFGMKSLIPVFAVIFRGTKYYAYFMSAENNMMGWGLILVLIPTVIPAFALQKYMDKDHKLRNTIYMTLPLRMVGYYIYYAYRIYYYFSMQNVIAFPYALERIRRKNRFFVSLFIAGACLIWFFLYYGWLSAHIYFPYMTYKECGIYGTQ